MGCKNLNNIKDTCMLCGEMKVQWHILWKMLAATNPNFTLFFSFFFNTKEN